MSQRAHSLEGKKREKCIGEVRKHGMLQTRTHLLEVRKREKGGNTAPGVHDYNIQSETSKEKGKSLPDTKDDIDESLQKAIDQSIRESPLALKAILPP